MRLPLGLLKHGLGRPWQMFRDLGDGPSGHPKTTPELKSNVEFEFLDSNHQIRSEGT